MPAAVLETTTPASTPFDASKTRALCIEACEVNSNGQLRRCAKRLHQRRLNFRMHCMCKTGIRTDTFSKLLKML